MIKFKQKIFYINPMTGKGILPSDPNWDAVMGERQAAAGLVKNGVYTPAANGSMEGRSVTGIGNGVYELNNSGGTKSAAYRELLGITQPGGMSTSEQGKAQLERDKLANQERVKNLEANQQGHENAAIKRFEASQGSNPQSTLIGNQIKAQDTIYHNQQQQKYNDLFGLKTSNDGVLSAESFQAMANDQYHGSKEDILKKQNEIFDQFEAEQKAKEASSTVKTVKSDSTIIEPAKKQGFLKRIKGKVSGFFNGAGNGAPTMSTGEGAGGLGYTGAGSSNSADVLNSGSSIGTSKEAGGIQAIAESTTTKKPGFLDGIRSTTENGSIREAVGRNISNGASAVGQGIKNGASAVGQGIKNGASAVGQGIKNGASAVGSAASKFGSSFMQGVRNTTANGSIGEAIGRNTINGAKKLGSGAVKVGKVGLAAGGATLLGAGLLLHNNLNSGADAVKSGN